MQRSKKTQSRNIAARKRPLFDPLETARAIPDAGVSSPNDPQPLKAVWVKARRQPTQNPFKIPGVTARAVRRHQLREMVPLADTTIYEMEQRGEFPRRFYLTPRCVVWDAFEVESWIDERRRASDQRMIELAPRPDVRKRSNRPVRGP
jgi:prophage regulatory protein